MERFSKNTKGITLIALVVTIIVLLILAAVSLNLVAGESGILSRAEKATNETVRGAAKEEVQLELADLLSKYYEEKYPNHNASLAGKTAGEYIKENANGTTTSGYTYTIGTADTNGNYKVTVNDNQGNQVATGTMTKEGKLSLENSDNDKVVSNAITATNYGDEITNYTANGISDWRIFYKDAEGTVYLISKDYLPANKIPSGAGMVTANEYRTSWYESSFPVTDLSNAQSKFMYSKMLGQNGGTVVTTSNINYKATASLLDTTIWSNFANDEKEFGYSAIGSPTVEMWMSSWNQKYNDTLVYNTTSTGYQVGTNESSLGNFIDTSAMNQKAGYKVEEANNMYYPHKSAMENGNCYGYWLASPSAYGGSNSLLRVYFDGSVYNDYYSSTDFGVRPVVCLKSDVKLTKNENGKWTLSK